MEDSDQTEMQLPAGSGTDLHAAFDLSRGRIPAVKGESLVRFEERLLRHLWLHRGPRDFLTLDPHDVPGYGWRFRPPLGMILLLSTSYVIFRLLYNATEWMPGLGISSPNFIAVSQAVMFAVAVLLVLLAMPLYQPAGGIPPPAAPGHDPYEFQRRIRQRMEGDED